MTDLTDTFLTGMLAYGAPALSAALLLGALGLPLPSAMFLLAAGAFVRQGVLDWSLTVPLALLATVAGDSGGYCLGRCGGPLVLKRVENSAVWGRARATFDRRGGVAILLTRFLLTPLATPINLIAGSSRYSFARFVFFDVLGELAWIALYGTLGYVFAESWELLNDLMGNISGLLVGVVVLGVGAYLASRYWRGKANRRVY